MMRAIDVRELLSHPGASSDERIAEPVEGLRNELVEVPADAPVNAELRLERIPDGIVVTGTLRARTTVRCARCLKEFDEPVEVRVEELFTLAPDPDSDEYPLAPEGELDPEPMVRDAVGLALPFAPVCRPDCKGLCERCGGDRNLGECRCAEPVDPRWAPLEGLL